MIRPAKGRGGQRGDDHGTGCRRTFGFGNGVSIAASELVRYGRSAADGVGTATVHQAGRPLGRRAGVRYRSYGTYPYELAREVYLGNLGETRPLKGLAEQRYSPERVEDAISEFRPEVLGSSCVQWCIYVAGVLSALTFASTSDAELCSWLVARKAPEWCSLRRAPMASVIASPHSRKKGSSLASPRRRKHSTCRAAKNPSSLRFSGPTTRTSPLMR